MSQSLRQIHPTHGTPEGASVRAEFELDRAHGTLIARYEVNSPEPVRTNPDLARGSSQWGLWDWDVVELFLSVGSRGPDGAPKYFEFVVSPLAQHFELEIFEPRKRFNREWVSGFERSARVLGPRHWSAEMRIPLARLGWDGRAESLTGNAFAILGPEDAKSYWSLFLPMQEQPDFHLPQYFRPLSIF